MAFIEIKAALNNGVLYMIYYLLLDKPSLMSKVGTHEGPKLCIYIFTI